MAVSFRCAFAATVPGGHCDAVKARIHCGAPLEVKQCIHCLTRGWLRQPQMTGQECRRCGRLLLPWCEALAIEGDRCEHHVCEPRHPEAPTTVVDCMLHHVLKPQSVPLFYKLREMADVDRAQLQSVLMLVRAAEENTASWHDSAMKAQVFAVKSRELNSRMAVDSGGEEKITINIIPHSMVAKPDEPKK